MNKIYTGKRFLYGVVYYPEQWPESKWDSDLGRIADTGMNIVRMGEGAWSVWEPEEGRYEFGLFDRALELCQKRGLQAIMGTPTYAPPAWLTQRYPEVLRVDYRGTPMVHGSRRHYNYTSPVYIEKSKAITEELAQHYREHPAVIGWQIDNEFNCHMDVSFAESDQAAFREWCRQKYGSLEALNHAWGTAFWSLTFSDWSQVSLPRPTTTYQNPSLLLDFYRFTSAVTVRFGAMQYEILKRAAPHQFVTHNAFHGMQNVDLHDLVAQAVDFLSYDSYPEFQVCQAILPVEFRDRYQARYLSKIRGVSEKFVVLEQQSGPSGQIGGGLNGNPDYLHPTPKPGQMRLWVWNSIANGADGILYFRWRSLPYSAEAHWNGLLYHDERNQWRLGEARQIGAEIRRLEPVLLETRCSHLAAIVYNYDNESHAKIDRFTGQFRPLSDFGLYRALAERHLTPDLRPLKGVAAAVNLIPYQIVFFPEAHILTATELAVLADYVERGGTLVFGAWSGYRNENHWCYDAEGKAFFEKLTGVRVADFTIVTPGQPIGMKFGKKGSPVNAPVFNEVLEPLGDAVKILANYTDDYYAEKPAVTLHRYGQGRVVYFGSFFEEENVSELLDALKVDDPLEEWMEVSRHIHAVTRTNGSERFCFLLNFTSEPQKVEFRLPSLDLLGERKLSGKQEIPPFGIIFARSSSGGPAERAAFHVGREPAPVAV
jgi:beta-galactosidase